jgi:hypothetical protein
MRRYLQFNIGVILAVSFLCAMVFAKYQTFWAVLVLAESLLIWIAIEIQSRRIPSALAKSSESNFQRLDGSVSRRREAREKKAKRIFRMDLIGTWILVALSLNWIVLLIDSLVIPLPVAAETLAAFRFDSSAWGTEIRNRQLDTQYATWVGTDGSGNSGNIVRPHFVRVTFPIMAGALLLWLVGSLAYLVVSYKYVLDDFAVGIETRSRGYLSFDVGRKQDSGSHPALQSASRSKSQSAALG